MKVLQVGAELYPLVKTGGLADVMAALPVALAEQGADVRLLLPGFPGFADVALKRRVVARLGALFGAARVDVLRVRLPGSPLDAYLIDAPYLFGRAGNPYVGPDGRDWPDNLARFALLGWIGAHLAAGDIDPAWMPDALHAHDWHAAMACAYVKQHPPTAAATVLTIHNLAFQGNFPAADFGQLGLPSAFMTPHGLEFHRQLSFMKAGLLYADRVSTVSPTYAREIATHEFGCGLEGVVRERGAHVVGILNGIDLAVWDPAHDALVASAYDATSLAGKAACKRALQQECGLDARPDAPMFGVVSRLTSQKGLDLLLSALPAALHQGAQLVVQGTGDSALESAYRRAAEQHPRQVSVHIGYAEARAHRLVAGSDVIVVPSRFEPCGLTQMYGLRYGTLPLVRRVGGLADTVVDADERALGADRATGFVFGGATVASLEGAMMRAIALYRDPARWQTVMRRAMAQDHGWDSAALQYLSLFGQAMRARGASTAATPVS